MTRDSRDEPLAGKRAAVMIGPQFEDTEALYPLYRLREAGAQVAVIGSEAGVTVPGKKGHELKVEQAAGDVRPEELDLLVIAGGYGPDKLRTDEGVLRLVRDLHADEKPIAFICHAGWAPAYAGIAGGQRATPPPPLPHRPR